MSDSTVDSGPGSPLKDKSCFWLVGFFLMLIVYFLAGVCGMACFKYTFNEISPIEVSVTKDSNDIESKYFGLYLINSRRHQFLVTSYCKNLKK